jgi:general secretion pathway protein G
MLVTSQLNNRRSGFTLIELLVVLILLGLVLALTVPNVMSWLDTRERSARIEEFTAKVQHLPLKASTQNMAYVLFDGAELELDSGSVSFNPALEVLQNGYCKGATATLFETDFEVEFLVSAPYCAVQVTGGKRL